MEKELLERSVLHDCDRTILFEELSLVLLVLNVIYQVSCLIIDHLLVLIICNNKVVLGNLTIVVRVLIHGVVEPLEGVLIAIVDLFDRLRESIPVEYFLIVESFFS